MNILALTLAGLSFTASLCCIRELFPPLGAHAADLLVLAIPKEDEEIGNRIAALSSTR